MAEAKPIQVPPSLEGIVAPPPSGIKPRNEDVEKKRFEEEMKRQKTKTDTDQTKNRKQEQEETEGVREIVETVKKETERQALTPSPYEVQKPKKSFSPPASSSPAKKPLNSPTKPLHLSEEDLANLSLPQKEEGVLLHLPEGEPSTPSLPSPTFAAPSPKLTYANPSRIEPSKEVEDLDAPFADLLTPPETIVLPHQDPPAPQTQDLSAEKTVSTPMVTEEKAPLSSPKTEPKSEEKHRPSLPKEPVKPPIPSPPPTMQPTLAEPSLGSTPPQPSSLVDLPLPPPSFQQPLSVEPTDPLPLEAPPTFSLPSEKKEKKPSLPPSPPPLKKKEEAPSSLQTDTAQAPPAPPQKEEETNTPSIPSLAEEKMSPVPSPFPSAKPKESSSPSTPLSIKQKESPSSLFPPSLPREQPEKEHSAHSPPLEHELETKTAKQQAQPPQEKETTPTLSLLPAPSKLASFLASPPPAYTTLSAPVFQLFTEIVGTLSVMQVQKGIRSTTLTLNGDAFRSSIFFGCQITIKESEHAKNIYNITLSGSGTAFMELHKQKGKLEKAFKEGFDKGEFRFKVHLIEVEPLREEKEEE